MAQPEGPGPGRVIVGAAFVIIGTLIFIPSGLCSAILGVIAISDMLTSWKGFLKDAEIAWPYFVAVFAVAIAALVMVRIGLAIRGRK